MDVGELERRVAEARKRADSAAKRLSRGGADAAEAFAAALDEQHAAERALAAARGEEYAVPFELGVRWSPGAPLPCLLSSGVRSFVTFHLDDEPDWEGGEVPMGEAVESLALAEFTSCVAVKLGPPNDEVLHGHPLYERGLEGYGAYTVENSRWLAEVIEINRVHDLFDPQSWKDAKHFLLVFHDETVEAIARDIVVQPAETSMRALLAETLERL